MDSRRFRTQHVVAFLMLAAGCAAAPRIVDRPISFSSQRQEMTRAYITEHYGVKPADITITPRMVVLHWTAIDDFAASFRAFDRETLGDRPDLAGASPVNVSIQFLVDRDGTIYRLMPENWMARHVIGLNYDAIGVENVGGADGVDNLTDAQIKANTELVRYLKRKYPTIEYLIGHHEYQLFEKHPLWRELDNAYRTAKIDPGPRFMNAVRSQVASLGLKGAPEIVAAAPVQKPAIIPHSVWQSQAPVGHAADATRRNLAPGDSLRFKDVHVRLIEMNPPARGDSVSTAVIDIAHNGVRERHRVRARSAFNRAGMHFAVLAINTGEGLGSGLMELEIGTLESIPPHIAAATISGDATYRLRVPHRIDKITLHHSGDAQPLRPQDDVAAKLRGLQSWGQAERNWWDVPYHFLIDLEGKIYEGRDYRYMGETNTRYDPSGHFLITVIGNYEIQQPTPAQIRAITDMMTWAAAEFGVSTDQIYGHGDLAQTDCPGRYLRTYLTDGTFRRNVAARLQRR
jgi:N-acetylmuramoyl-L-alanine amidase